MTLSGLLAIAAITIATYAIARPAERRSIMLFVPIWLVPLALAVSAIILILLDGLAAWGVPAPKTVFVLRTAAFLIPICAALWAIYRWKKAELTEDADTKFREFLLSSLRDGTFAECVRIIKNNRENLPSILSKETVELLFDRQFIGALTASRSWVHLELLTDKRILEAHPRHFRAVDRTVRELLSADESPLRNYILAEGSADETVSCSDEDEALIKRTFLKPDWYERTRADCPLVLAAIEFLNSGEADDAYNRNDSLYIASEGISSRSRCPVFLAAKTIFLSLCAALDQRREADYYFTVLSDIFRAVYRHSRYDPEMWESERGQTMEYPTPVAYLLSNIIRDVQRLSDKVFENAEYGQNAPGEMADWIVRTYVMCVAQIARDGHHMSEQFRVRLVRDFFNHILERKSFCDHPPKDKGQPLAEWHEGFIEPIQLIIDPGDKEVNDFLTRAANSLDLGKRYVFECHKWLRAELGLPPRPKPVR